MQVVWTDPALERVEQIAVYIAGDDPDAAVRWTVELFAAVARLADFPESGSRADLRCVSCLLPHRSVRPSAVRSARQSTDSLG
jgi:plasmid stabilization system protein ParE